MRNRRIEMLGLEMASFVETQPRRPPSKHDLRFTDYDLRFGAVRAYAELRRDWELIRLLVATHHGQQGGRAATQPEEMSPREVHSLFNVAQIGNLPCRRMGFGRPSASSRALELSIARRLTTCDTAGFVLSLFVGEFFLNSKSSFPRFYDEDESVIFLKV